LERQLVVRDQIASFVRTASGSSRQLVDVARLGGGSKKGVYRLTLDEGATTILYVWSAEENYWPDGGGDPADPLADASGAGLFAAGHAQLDALGVRTPRPYLLERGRSHHPADLALVEDVQGGTLEALIERDPRAADASLEMLGAALRLMARHRSTHIGKVAFVERGSAPQDRSRFGRAYPRIQQPDLDAARMEFYRLALLSIARRHTEEVAAAVR
jgi:hypothetical protein